VNQNYKVNGILMMGIPYYYSFGYLKTLVFNLEKFFEKSQGYYCCEAKIEATP